MNTTIDNYLQKIYYDPELGLSSVKNLWERTKGKIPGLTKKYLTEWYKRQETAQIFAKPKRIYNRIIGQDSSSWQLDLTFYNQFKAQNSNFIGMMTIINVTTKYAYAFPIKSRAQSEINRVFDLFMKKELPKSITSDNEASLIKTVKRYKIKHFLSEPNTHGPTAIVERFNRTLRDRLTKYFKTAKTKTWVTVLPSILKNYNSTIHSATKTAPKDMTAKKQDEYRLKLTMTDAQSDLKPGDKVRVLKPKELFEKGSDKFSRKIYTIEKVNPKSFLLKNPEGDVLTKRFKIRELLKVTVSESVVIPAKPAPKKKEMVKKQTFVRRQRREKLPGTKLSKEGQIILNRLLPKDKKRKVNPTIKKKNKK